MAKAPLTRLDLQVLANSRLAVAYALRQSGHHDGALYLAGYALEFAFKARICNILDAHYPLEIQGFRTHSYQVLLKLAGLERALDIKKSDVNFSANWSILIGGTAQLQGWSEEWRYRAIGSVTAAEANVFLQALDDPAAGVFSWIKTVW